MFVVISKILVPQTEKIDSDVKISGEKIGKNVLDAISNGTGEGLRLAVNVGAMLLVFVAFIALINSVFALVGDWTSLNSWVAEISNEKYKALSIEFVAGLCFCPVDVAPGSSIRRYYSCWKSAWRKVDND